jgi:hypothetical protein
MATTAVPAARTRTVQLRAGFFNVTNTPNPAAAFGTGTFERITSTTTENRDIQFGLEVVF